MRLDGVAGDAGHLDAATEQRRRHLGRGAHLGGADRREVGRMGQQDAPTAEKPAGVTGQSGTRVVRDSANPFHSAIQRSRFGHSTITSVAEITKVMVKIHGKKATLL